MRLAIVLTVFVDQFAMKKLVVNPLFALDNDMNQYVPVHLEHEAIRTLNAAARSCMNHRSQSVESMPTAHLNWPVSTNTARILAPSQTCVRRSKRVRYWILCH